MRRSRLFARTAVATLCSFGAVGVVHAQDGMISQLEASLRLGLQLETEPDTTINFQDFASRVRWNGLLSMSDSTNVTGYLEFGFDEDSGLSNTRQAWVGVSGEFGTLKGGKQYRAFYDATSSFTDVAYIGSCFFQIGCSRQEAVVKYERPLGEGARIVASGTMVNGDEGDDLFDELEAGGIFQLGDITLGAVAGFRASEGFDDSGAALGVAVSSEFGGVTVSSSLQFADSDYARGSNDDVLLLNASASMDRWYAVAGFEDAETTPFFATLGYEYPLVDDALVYGELQVFEPDGDADGDGFDDDAELFLRTVFVYNFGAVGFPREGSR